MNIVQKVATATAVVAVSGLLAKAIVTLVNRDPGEGFANPDKVYDSDDESEYGCDGSGACG